MRERKHPHISCGTPACIGKINLAIHVDTPHIHALGKKGIRMANTSPKGDGRKVQIRNLLVMIFEYPKYQNLKIILQKTKCP